MNFAGAYRNVGKVDIETLQSRVLALIEAEWFAYGARQVRYEVHRDTNTIPVLFDEDGRHSDPTSWPLFDTLKGELDPILAIVRRHYNQSLTTRRLQERNGAAYPVRIILTRLRPGGVIPAHADGGFSLTHAHRIHLPIFSRGNVRFSVDGVEKHLPEGELWEINNRRLHAVHNVGSENRIHLIIDWAIPGERCCCSKRTNPHGQCSPTHCARTDAIVEPCHCLK